jgi:hypothetical protein
MLAATGFAASDVGKLAWTTDSNSVWMLTAASPPTWVAINPAAGAGQRADTVAINYGTSPYWPTQAVTYEVIGTMVFRGTAIMGVPQFIKAVAWCDVGSSGAVRIYDATNALQVCANTAIVNTSKAVVSLGALSNLSSSEAVWEIQAYRVTGSGAMRGYTASVQVQY